MKKKLDLFMEKVDKLTRVNTSDQQRTREYNINGR